jgi:hypothetical protein
MLWKVFVSSCIFMPVPDDGFMEKLKIKHFWTIKKIVCHTVFMEGPSVYLNLGDFNFSVMISIVRVE